MKDKSLLQGPIYVGFSDIEGKGVFAREDIRAGVTVEEAHYLVLEDREWKNCDKELIKYVFALQSLSDNWKEFCDEHGGLTTDLVTRPIAVLGFGMIYNHSKEENLVFKIDDRRKVVTYIAKKDIEQGDELTINYGEQYWSDREDEK